MPRIHLSCESQSIGKLSEKAKSVVFAFSRNRLGSRKPRREAPAVFCELRGKPYCSAESRYKKYAVNAAHFS